MFYRGAAGRGVSREVVDQVWEMILSFAGYSFCKPHSASYALVSYKSCWLRAHYPAEFIAAVLTNQGGYYSPFAYVSEARRMGLQVLLPDVNESRKEYWGKDRTLRVGLMQLKGLQEAGLEALLEERQEAAVCVAGGFSGPRRHRPVRCEDPDQGRRDGQHCRGRDAAGDDLEDAGVARDEGGAARRGALALSGYRRGRRRRACRSTARAPSWSTSWRRSIS